MSLTKESHRLRVRTGECYRDRPIGQTGDLPDRAQAAALRKNIHHCHHPHPASAKPGLHTKTDLDRDLKNGTEVSITEF
jgi:hypothetical protein